MPWCVFRCLGLSISHCLARRTSVRMSTPGKAMAHSCALASVKIQTFAPCPVQGISCRTFEGGGEGGFLPSPQDSFSFGGVELLTINFELLTAGVSAGANAGASAGANAECCNFESLACLALAALDAPSLALIRAARSRSIRRLTRRPGAPAQKKPSSERMCVRRCDSFTPAAQESSSRSSGIDPSRQQTHQSRGSIPWASKGRERTSPDVRYSRANNL